MSDTYFYQLPPGTDVAAGLPPVDLPVTGNKPAGPLRVTVGKQPVPEGDPWAGYPTERPAAAATTSAADPWAGYPTERPPPSAQETKARETQISAPAAAAMGVAEGASFGTAPAIAGTHAAGMSLLPQEVQDAVDKHGHAAVLGPLIAGLTRLGYEDLIKPALGLGSGGAGTEAYNKSREGYGAEQQAAQEQHPVAYTAGQVGGALATPGFGVGGGGASVLGRVGAGSLAGGIGGSLYSTGQAISEGKDPGIGAALSTIASGGLNAPALYRAATSPAVTGFLTGSAFGGGGAAALNAVQKGAQKVASVFRGARDTDTEAARRILLQRKADFEANGTPWTPETIKALREGNIPLANVDIGGEGTRALARSAANTSPQGRQALTDFLEPRAQGQSQRAANFIREMFGGSRSIDKIESLQNSARKANAPAYKRTYAAGDYPITSPELERLMGSRTIADAARASETRWGDYQILDGYGAANPPVKVTPDGRFVSTGGKGIPTYPNIQFWDYTARVLAEKAATARSGANPNFSEANRYGGLERMLKAELDKLVPSYAAAREGAHQAFKAENALEAGKNYVMETATGKDELKLRRAYAAMKGPERELFAHGFASEMADKFEKIGFNRDILNETFINNKKAKERIELALGPARAAQLEAYLRAESLVTLPKKALGNSTTLRQAAEAGMAGGGAVAAYDEATGADFNPSHIFWGALFGSSLRHGAKRIDEKVSRRVAEMLASSDPAILDKGVKIIASRPYLMDALRRATGAGTRVAAHDIGPTRAIAGAGATIGSMLTPSESKSVNPYSNSQFVNQ